MQQSTAGETGREFANATNPSSAELERKVWAQLAERGFNQQHSEAGLRDT